MTSFRRLGLVVILAAGPALADGLPATYKFTKRMPNTEQYVELPNATFDDHVCFEVTGFAADGEHPAEITIFDGGGREVARVFKTVTARGARWGMTFCMTPIKDEDVPGEWWFNATLDDNLAASASLMVAYGRPKGEETKSRKSK